jgi:uncharacterized protein (DUF927 family)
MLSAEQSIRDFLKCHGAPAEDGEAVRLLEIPVPNRAQGGIFAGAVNSAALAQELADFMKAQHGTVLYQWIRKLQKSDPSALDDSARQQEQSFLDSLGNLPHHHTRFAKHFALIAATAYLATHEKIIPVKHDRCLGAVRRMFRLAVSEMAHSAEEQQSCWRDFFALCKDRRLFPLVSIGNSVGDEALGFVRRKERREIIYLPQSALVSKFGDAFVTRVLIPRLREAQLVPASGETTRPVSQAGLPRGRYLSFDVTKLRALKGQVLSLPGERPDR